MLRKSDFLSGCPKNNLYKLDAEYAYKKYHKISKDNLFEYFKNKESVDLFLLNLQFVGGKAFYYYVPCALAYIKNQSKYWHSADVFENFDNIEIDDSALSAFEVLPNLIETRFKFCKKDTGGQNMNLIKEFTQWALHNIDKFDDGIFENKIETKEEYSRLEKLLSKESNRQ
jgi:hypothetical protein